MRSLPTPPPDYPVDVHSLVPGYGRFSPLVLAAVRAALAVESAPTGREVAVVLCDDEEIAAYHERFMGLSGPTDVLSWPSDVALGDVMVSCETALRQAGELGHSWEREVCVLAVHGTLHLLGWDDHGAEEQAAMQARVDEIVDAALGHERPQEQGPA